MQEPDRSRARPHAVLILLGCVLSYAIFRAGGVIPVDSYVAAAALSAVSLLVLLTGRQTPPAPAMSRFLRWPLVLFPAYLAFQLIPLPLALLSPARASIHRALALVLASPGFAPISVIPAATWLHLVRAVNCVLIFLAVRQVVWRLGRRPWVAALPLVLIGVCEAAAGLLQFGSPQANPLSAGTYVNHNHFAGLLEMILPFAVLYPVALLSRFGTSDIRTEIWAESLPLVRSYWLLGCGSGGYESVFMQYKRTDPMFRIDYAHNDYLQRLIEWGVAGCLIAATWMAAVFWQARRAARRHPALSARALAVACIASLVAILLHSLVDFNLYIPGNAMVLAWICGIAVSVTFSSYPVRVSQSHSGVRVVDVQNC